MMSKEKAIPASNFIGEIFQFGIYKPSQGRVTRQVTCASIWVGVAVSAYALYQWLSQYTQLGYWEALFLHSGIPLIVVVVGFWAGYRIVNYAKFADFLIAVEAEMNKVSWPARAELIRASSVVIFVIFALAFLLFGYDVVWKFLFESLGILQRKGA